MSTEHEASPRRSSFELGTDGPTTVLVAVDGSQSAERAMAYAAGLARRNKARLVAVYVRKTPVALTGDAYAAAGANAAQDAIEAGLRAGLRDALSSWGVDADFVVCSGGDPVHALAEIAQRFRADAIVVGSATSFLHRIVGSLPSGLIRKGQCPVTVVP